MSDGDIADTHDAICHLYDDLRDQTSPEDSYQERAAAAAARARPGSTTGQRPLPSHDLIDDPAYQPKCGELPATLAGVLRRPMPTSPVSLPAPISSRGVTAQPVRGHRTSTTVRVTAGTQLSTQGAPHGTATA